MNHRALTLCWTLLALTAAARAGTQTWVPVGPPGGDVRSLAADPHDPRRIYLGTADGVVYRSDDAGLRWQRMSPGFPLRGRSLDDIVVHPDGALFAGYWQVEGGGGGVARSGDGGRTFTLLPGIEGESVRALAASPSNPDVLVAGAIGGVFRSLDGGRSWRRISPEGHIDLRNVESVAIDPVKADLIYVGTWHLPWKTPDGGRTWYPISSGMITDSDVMTLTLDRRSSRILYATACSGIYRSTDAAARWTKVRGIPSSSRRTRAFAQSPDDPNTVYAGTTQGLWMSVDGGAGWTLATPQDLVVNSVVALPGGTVLLGGDGVGVLRSVDAGRSWIASNDGFSERFVSRLVFDPAEGRILAGVWGDRRHGGVFSAPGPGGPWVKLGVGLEGREVISLAARGSDVLAGTDDGLFLLSGSPASWRRLPTLVAGVDAHPRATDVLVLPRGVILAATSRGVLRSLDGGATWKRPALGLSGQASALAASPKDQGVVLASTPLGFFKSVDGGERWVQASGGIDVAPHTLAFLPDDDRVVFAATPRGLFRSADQGQTWARCRGGVPFTDITGLAVHAGGRTLYASDFTAGGIFRSRDGGETWKRLPSDGLLTERAWTLAVDPASPERVLIASPTGGLHLLTPPEPASAAAGSQ